MPPNGMPIPMPILSLLLDFPDVGGDPPSRVLFRIEEDGTDGEADREKYWVAYTFHQPSQTMSLKRPYLRVN